MPIVTISRGSYTRGRKLAEDLAEKMGYDCIAREVLLEASKRFNTPEIKLERALHDAPSVLDRFTYGKEKYLAYIREAILEQMVKDNVIYHGLAGHIFLQDVDHLLRIRIHARIEDRIKEEIRRKNISEEKARYILKKDDQERRKWSVFITGTDPYKLESYELVFNASIIPIEDIVEIVANILKKPYMQKTPESQSRIEDLYLAARINAALVEDYPSAKVQAKGGNVHVFLAGPLSMEDKLYQEIKDIVSSFPGVKETNVHLVPQA